MNDEILCFELDDRGRDYVRGELARVLRKGADTLEYFNMVVLELESVITDDRPRAVLPARDTANGQPYVLTVPGSMYDTYCMADAEQEEEWYLRATGDDECMVNLPDYATTGDIDGDALYHAIRGVLEATGVRIVYYDGWNYIPVGLPDWEYMDEMADPSVRDAFIAKHADALAALAKRAPGRFTYPLDRKTKDDLLTYAFRQAARLGADVLTDDKRYQ